MRKGRRSPRLGVAGLWHLGSVISAAWSGKGFRVTGFDPDPGTVRALSRGEPPVFEPGLKEALSRSLGRKTLDFTFDVADLSGCDFVFLAFDTPVLDDDRSDLAPLENAVASLGRVLKDGSIVIVSSQTPAGTCARFRKELKSLNPALDCAYSPENLRLGEALSNYLRPGRIILGAAEESTRRKVQKLFSAIPAEVVPMGLASAEMVKHGINAFLAGSVAFANELADLCENIGADVRDVVAGMKSDPRIGERAYLSPGIGFSGGTLGRDLRVLDGISGNGGAGSLFGKALESNGRRKAAIVAKIESLSPGGVRGRRIGVLGLTYKPGTSTLRRSLPAEIVRLLAERGALITVFDPKADLGEWTGGAAPERARSAEDVVRGSEIVLLLTEWPEFLALPWKKLAGSGRTVFDAKGFLAPLGLGDLGYRYHRIGNGEKRHA
ncbi:MAG: hypothetical protein A2902_06105 [Elusimicrobia bacterium RIFCSPLOWO2_01_FULL_64_13]|nr:MAG: hypothetical protein A2902_06105 [Elusimicrobia bacterium RIFCSPLOWO2_01_FULL_64_13]